MRQAANASGGGIKVAIDAITRFRDDRWMALDGLFALGNLAAMSRESKRDRLVKLREQFEEDKQRIEKMKSERRFKPY